MTPVELWHYFEQSNRGYSIPPQPSWVDCFADNRRDANQCAQLVLAGIKRATAPSLWELEFSGEPYPCVGDFGVFTDWDGNALGVVRTSKVEVVPFSEVTATFAKLEGEGDGSLAHWRRVHWHYYQRILAASSRRPESRMPVVCEQFELLLCAASPSLYSRKNP